MQFRASSERAATPLSDFARHSGARQDWVWGWNSLKKLGKGRVPFRFGNPVSEGAARAARAMPPLSCGTSHTDSAAASLRTSPVRV